MASVPLGALLEITKRCNLHCYHCYVAGRDRELPTGRWLRLVDELAESGCMSVSLTGGELALRDDFLVLAEAVRRQRMTLTVLTNGTLFSVELTDELASLRPSLVSISLYGASAGPHESVTGVPGSFDRAVETAKRLVERRVRCRITTVLMNGTISEYRGLVELAESLGCEHQFDPTVAPRADGDTRVLRHRISGERLAQFYLHEVTPSRTRERMAAETVGPHAAGHPHVCGAGFTGLFVDAGGDLFACVGLEPSFGSIAERPFLEVWRGPRANAYRERMRTSRSECRDCRLSPLCSTFCPRLALAEDGKVDGKSTRACEMAGVTEALRQALRA
jgi:radical SAM protein with 4Fe4S-binding SPASM domain